MINLYRKKELQPMFPWTPDLNMGVVSISGVDKENGSPKAGDMIAYHPDNAADMWLVARDFFNENYKFVESVND